MQNYVIGQHLIFHWEEKPWGANGSVECIVKEVHDDHAIAIGDGMTLWIDDDTEYQFVQK